MIRACLWVLSCRCMQLRQHQVACFSPKTRLASLHACVYELLWQHSHGARAGQEDHAAGGRGGAADVLQCRLSTDVCAFCGSPCAAGTVQLHCRCISQWLLCKLARWGCQAGLASTHQHLMENQSEGAEIKGAAKCSHITDSLL